MLDCLPYFGVFGLVFALNTLAITRVQKPQVKKAMIIFGFLILLMFIGFRYNVGTDYDNYLSLYHSVERMPWQNIFSIKLEPVVAIIFKLCSYTVFDPRIIFIIFGALLLYPLYKANKLYDYKYLPYSILIFCVLLLPFGMNGMRQGIAMSFSLLSFVYIIKNRYKMGFLNLFIAILFHTSAWLVVPYLIMVIIAYRKKLSYTRLNMAVTAFVVIAMIFFLNDMLVEYGIDRYNYMLSDIDLGRISFIAPIIYLPIIILIALLRGDSERSKEIMIYKNLVITSFIFYTLGTSAQNLTRFSYYFMMPSIIVLPMLFQNIEVKNTRFVIKVLFIVYLVLFFYVQYSVIGRHDILPYQTWMFGDIL